jgi:hypothetical protein
MDAQLNDPASDLRTSIQRLHANDRAVKKTFETMTRVNSEAKEGMNVASGRWQQRMRTELPGQYEALIVGEAPHPSP